MTAKIKKPVPLFNEEFFENVSATLFRNISKRLPSTPPQEPNEKFTDVYDRKLHAIMGKYSQFSPGALVTTYVDWSVHLAMSPGKQLDLATDAWQKGARFFKYCGHNTPPSDCATPLPFDKRFDSPAWDAWPYHIYKQAFLLTEEWWVSATSEVRGVTQHHADVLPFLTRQVIDMVCPVNHPLTNPVVVDKTIAEGGINLIKGTKNFYEDISTILQGAPTPGTENYIVGKDVAITPGQVIFQNDLIELIQYAPQTKTVYPEPILIIPAWIMKYYILDLSPHNSLVKFLVALGHTVYMVSWKNPSEKDRDVSFSDYIQKGVMAAVDVVSGNHPETQIHAAGYCLGGTLLTIAAALMAHKDDTRLKSLTLFAAQIDFEEAGELLFFIDESQLAFLEDIMWDKGYLDDTSMANTFYMLRSNDLIWSRMVENYLLGERQSLTDLMAWNADTTRMPYKMHSEYLRSLFLNNDLSSGRFKIDNQTVSVNDIAAPVFVVGTQKDHISPWQSVYKIHLFLDTEITFVLTSGGHNAGIVSEPGHPHRTYQLAVHKHTDIHIDPQEWQDQMPHFEGSWWIPWEEWLNRDSGDKGPVPPMGMAIRKAPGQYVRKRYSS